MANTPDTDAPQDGKLPTDPTHAIEGAVSETEMEAKASDVPAASEAAVDVEKTPSGDSADASSETIAIDVPSPAGPSLLEKYTSHYPEWAKE